MGEMGEAMSDPLWDRNSDGVLGILFVARIYLWCSSHGDLNLLIAGLGFIFLGSGNLAAIHLPAFLASKNLLLFY